jgi:F420-dependent oxidoreductase-like protein
MRIGLSGGGNTIERIVELAVEAEEDGFTSLWFAGAVAGDPLAALTVAARATRSIEMGTSVVQTYPCHPVLMANRAAAVALSAGRGFTLGVGPSHQPVIEGTYGMPYDHPGRHTEEYMSVLTSLIRGDRVDLDGHDLRAHAGGPASRPAHEVPVLLAALGPRLLRVAGQHCDGVILWMANARAVESHVVPRLTRAADAAGRSGTRVVVGLPVCVHDDVDEARVAAGEQFALYGALPNYQRILARGDISSPAEAVIVGNEESVRSQVEAIFAAGGTDFWAAPFAAGPDRRASRERTRSLLRDLAASS